VKGSWFFDTKWGRFAIVPTGGRFDMVFRDENLGTYHSAVAAMDDLISGYTYPLSGKLNPAKMGLPSELSGWAFERAE
jgi:hypothetical protein